MKTTVSVLTAFLAVAMFTSVFPMETFAVTEYENWMWGATSTTSVSSQKGAQAEIKVHDNHTFDFSGEEDHSYQIEVKDSSNYKHKIGYFLNSDGDQDPHLFIEVFNSAGVLQDSLEEMSDLSNGSTYAFQVYRTPNSWNFYMDGSWKLQYIGGGSSFNTFDLKVFGEKGCDGGCVIGDLGDSPTTEYTTAMEYADESFLHLADWQAVSGAQAYYNVRTDAGTNYPGSTARTAMCTPMTMEGNSQDTSILDNELDILDASSVTCTGATSTLWPYS